MVTHLRRRPVLPLLAPSCLSVPHVASSAVFCGSSWTGRQVPLDLRSTNSPTWRKWGIQHPSAAGTRAPCQGRSCISQPWLVPEKKNTLLWAAFLTTSIHCGLPDSAAAGCRLGQPGQMGLGMQCSGQRIHTPSYRGPPVAASTTKDLEPQGMARPWFTGQPQSWKAMGGSFSPSQGQLDSHPTNGAVAPPRLPAEHKSSHPQTLVTGGAMTLRIHRAWFPPHQQERLSAATQDNMAKGRGQDPNPTSLSTTPLKGQVRVTRLSTELSQNSSS